MLEFLSMLSELSAKNMNLWMLKIAPIAAHSDGMDELIYCIFWEFVLAGIMTRYQRCLCFKHFSSIMHYGWNIMVHKSQWQFIVHYLWPFKYWLKENRNVLVIGPNVVCLHLVVHHVMMFCFEPFFSPFCVLSPQNPSPPQHTHTQKKGKKKTTCMHSPPFLYCCPSLVYLAHCFLAFSLPALVHGFLFVFSIRSGLLINFNCLEI